MTHSELGTKVTEIIEPTLKYGEKGEGPTLVISTNYLHNQSSELPT